MFSNSYLRDAQQFTFGIGGPFAYMTLYQFSFWGYFSILRLVNYGNTLSENYTSVVDFKFYTKTQENELITTQFCIGNLTHSFIQKNECVLQRVRTDRDDIKNEMISEGARTIVNGEELLLDDRGHK